MIHDKGTELNTGNTESFIHSFSHFTKNSITDCVICGGFYLSNEVYIYA